MNIWAAFFLVVSIVILAAPVLLSEGTQGRSGSRTTDGDHTVPVLEDDELELDFACGRLTREDYEVMSKGRLKTKGPGSGAGGDHECVFKS